MKRISGIAASPGVVRGRWTRIDPPPTIQPQLIERGAVTGEVARLAAAGEAAALELEALAARVRDRGHPAEAEIFEAQAAIARDPALHENASQAVADDLVDAVGAIQRAGEGFAQQLRDVGDELLAARAADVLDVTDRIARHVAGVPAADQPRLGTPSIVVADDLPPSVTASLPRERLLGLALERSSPTAHAAILARAYGIPAVVGVTGLLAAVTAAGADDELAVDGGSGEVLVGLSDDDREEIDRRSGLAAARRARDLEEASLPAATLDGHAVTLLANIGSPDEAEAARQLGARGVGLFRTEFLFLERPTAPSEEEQLDAYRRAVEAFQPDPVTIRLLDVGGDKAIPYLHLPPEENPFLGVRALRLAWDAPSLFRTQLRACLRAATSGHVKVMAPMVADAGDVELLLRLAADARQQLDAEGIPRGDVELGVMLEIPSAILVAASYFGRIAFASLGTNDLLQYTLAVDRGNAGLERYRDALHPAVLRLVDAAATASRARGVDLSVCGEMAGDPAAALALVGLGVRSLSMAAAGLPAVRRAIRGVALADLETAATAALADASAADVRARFARFLTTAS